LGTEVAFFIEILDTIATVGQEAVGSASVGEGIIVEASSIALLTKSSINSTVTTFNSAISTTWNSSISVFDAIHGSEVALLSQASVKNAITASGEGAVSSASTIGVGVFGSVVALFDGSGGEETSATAWLAVSKACGGWSVSGSSEVTKFVPGQVDNAITASGKSTVGSAGIRGKSVGGSVVTLLTVVDDTVTTSGGCAGGSACIGDNVGVCSSVIAEFAGLDDSVTAQESAEFVAGSATDLCRVALFSVIDEAITAEWESAISLAFVGSVGIVFAFVTVLTSVHHTITASGEESASSASVGSGVRVHCSIIAFLTNGSFDQTIVQRALSKLGNVKVKLRDEGGFGGTSVEQDGNTNEAVSISGGVKELGFQIGVDTVDGVLGWGVEFNSAQSEAIEGVSSVDQKSQRSSGVDEVDGRERIGVGWQSEGWGTDTGDSRGDDVDG